MKKPKTSAASIRVLETLKILSNKNASVQDIIRHFEQIDPENRIYTNEVILKYINTLKVFGFIIVKEKDKYALLNPPDQFDLTEKDLNAIYFLGKMVEEFPEEKIQTEVGSFLQELEKRFSEKTRILSKSLKKTDQINLKINYTKYVKLIKECEKYCLDQQRLKINYKKQNRDEISAIVEPKELKYIGNDIYFSVYNPISAEIQDISLNSIVKIKQLPLKSNNTSMLSSVTFMLKDRLAKVYKLKEGEEIMQVSSDGTTIILNRREDRTLLLKRLMRYGENCEVLSPKSFREEMRQLIQTTLSNYG